MKNLFYPEGPLSWK